MIPRRRLLIESLVLPVAGVAVVLSLLYLSLWKSGQDDLLPDFLPLYAAGQLIRTDPASLYDPSAQLKTQQTAAGIRPESFLPFAYPPVTAGFFAPLTLLSYRNAYRVWVLISLLMLGLSIYLCSDNFQLGQEGRRFLAVGTIALFPVYIALVQGQTATLILLLFTLAFLALQRGSEWQAGVWVGLLFLKPQWLLLPALVLLGRKTWKALLSLFISVFLLVFAGISLVGWEGLRQLLALMLEMASGRETTAPPLHQYNLRALGFFLTLGPVFWISGSALVALLVTATWWRRENTPWHLSTLTLGMILTSPQANPHDLVLVVPALAVLIAEYESSLSLVHLLALVLFGLLPLLTVILVWPWTGYKIPVMAVVSLILFGFALRKAWRPCHER